MPSISHHRTFFRKRLEGVPWDEEGGLDVIFGEELQESANTDGTGEETCISISWKPLKAEDIYNHLWKCHS